MTEITPEALEALSKKATQGVWGTAAYYTGTGPDENCHGLVEVEDFPIGIIDEEGATAESLSPNLEFIVALVNLYRTGQLILAQPSVEITERQSETLHKALIASCSEFVEPIVLAQPSGDEVEAVAELQLAAFLAGRGSVVSMKQGTRTAKPAPTMDEFRRMARTALEAHRGKQACLKDRENSDG